MTELYFFPAKGGDFLWLRYSSSHDTFHNIIIDGGFQSCCHEFCAVMNRIFRAGESVEAILLTHFDHDHIGAFLRWLSLDGGNMPEIRRIYFNTGQGIAREFGLESDGLTFEQEQRYRMAASDYSVNQAYSILELLEARRLLPSLCSCQVMGAAPVELTGGATLRFISPSKESAIQYSKMFVAEPEHKGIVNYGGAVIPAQTWDDLDVLKESRTALDHSVSNGGSLAFLFDYDNIHLAFLGDAHVDICADGLRLLGYSKENPYRADFVKLSHHGSARNISQELLSILSCDDYLISTNTRKVERVHKMGIAMLLQHHTPIRLYWNCGWPEKMFTARDRERYIDTGALTMYRTDRSGFHHDAGAFKKTKEVTLYGGLAQPRSL